MGIHDGLDILQKGLANAAGLLGPVQNGDALHGLGQDGKERFCGEGTVQPNLQAAYLPAFLDQVIDGLFHEMCIRDRATIIRSPKSWVTSLT